MTQTPTEQDRRQNRHQIRARRARWAGRLLIPVLGLLISASLWSDPDVAKQLERGLEVVAGMTGPENPDDLLDDRAPEPKAKPVVTQLPKSRVKVNRYP
jgi:hypothetical protein